MNIIIEIFSIFFMHEEKDFSKPKYIYTHRTSQLGRAPFQVLSSHKCLGATELNSSALDSDLWRTSYKTWDLNSLFLNSLPFILRGRNTTRSSFWFKFYCVHNLHTSGKTTTPPFPNFKCSP